MGYRRARATVRNVQAVRYHRVPQRARDVLIYRALVGRRRPTRASAWPQQRARSAGPARPSDRLARASMIAGLAVVALLMAPVVAIYVGFVVVVLAAFVPWWLGALIGLPVVLWIAARVARRLGQ